MVNRYFPVVGVMEEMDKFFTVLEYVFPSYFVDARKVYFLKAREYYTYCYSNSSVWCLYNLLLLGAGTDDSMMPCRVLFLDN